MWDFLFSARWSVVLLNCHLQESYHLALSCRKIASMPTPSYNLDRLIILGKQPTLLKPIDIVSESFVTYCVMFWISRAAKHVRCVRLTQNAFVPICRQTLYIGCHRARLVRHVIYYDHSDIIWQLHSSGGSTMQKAVITLRIACTTFYIIFALLLIHSAFMSSNITNIKNEARCPLFVSRDILAATWSAAKPFTIWNTLLCVICAITYHNYWH